MFWDIYRGVYRMYFHFIIMLLALVFANNVLAEESKPSAVDSGDLELAQAEMSDFINMSPEELSQILVTSVSKREENAFKAPAAVYVVTGEDIRRSGFTSIPEVMRLVPGMQVAQITSNKWAIGSRAFNDQLATKLLVLIDGRSIYTPLFSGVNWDVHDVLIEDIERIEVIRGPGASLWGANAVNGVINIITKSAKKTQGTQITALYGNEEEGTYTSRYGGKLKNDTFYRIYSKYFKRDDSTLLAGNLDSGDGWSEFQGGFRIDSNELLDNSFTLQGDIYDIGQDRTSTLPVVTAVNTIGTETVLSNEERNGGNLIFRWNHIYNNGSDSSLQLYYDRIVRDNPTTLFQDRSTYDFDFQHRWDFNDKNEIVWGLGYRYIQDSLGSTFYLSYDPVDRDDELYSAFFQDEVTLISDTLFFTFGSKFEKNDYTSVEFQPNARLSWTPTNKQTLWTAVSRAVRTPNRSEDDISIVVGTFATRTGLFRWEGNKEFESEKVIAYEVGYRVQPTYDLYFDAAGFYNDYSDLRSLEPGAIFSDTSTNFPAHLVLPIEFGGNAGYGESYGFELVSTWDVNDSWTLKPSYSLTKLDLHTKFDSADTSLEVDEGKNVEHKVTLVSNLNLPNGFELDNSVYYTGDVESSSLQQKISDYVRFDTRLGWKPVEEVEFSLVGQNLLDDYHQEWFAPLHSVATQVGRSFYGKVTVNF